MTEVDDGVISAVALQLDVQAPSHTPGLLSDRTAERHRAEIRTLLGFREATVADGEVSTPE